MSSGLSQSEYVPICFIGRKWQSEEGFSMCKLILSFQVKIVEFYQVLFMPWTYIILYTFYKSHEKSYFFLTLNSLDTEILCFEQVPVPKVDVLETTPKNEYSVKKSDSWTIILRSI